jgi:hypothetical protein
MNVKAYLVDRISEEPLVGASVTIVDSEGKPLGPGVMTDSKGYFSITSDLLDKSGNQLMFSDAAYETVLSKPEHAYGEIYMERSGNMDEVVFTFVKKAKKILKEPKFTGPIVVGSLATIVLAVWIKKKFF